MRREPETIDLEALLGTSRQTLIATAHELKAPLSLIRMYAARLENGDLTDVERRQYNARLLFTAEQMLQLTSGLLEGQRWIEGQLPLEPVNAVTVCEEVLHELSPVARELDQKLNLQSFRRPGIAVGNAQLLKNVVFNVTFNALKHTPPGTDISVGATQCGDKTHISVVDTGPGFGKQTIQQVNGMKNQFQAEQSRAGSGLGLSVAKQLLAAMNGSLQIKPSPKGGYCLMSLNASRQLSLPL